MEALTWKDIVKIHIQEHEESAAWHDARAQYYRDELEEAERRVAEAGRLGMKRRRPDGH